MLESFDLDTSAIDDLHPERLCGLVQHVPYKATSWIESHLLPSVPVFLGVVIAVVIVVVAIIIGGVG